MLIPEYNLSLPTIITESEVVDSEAKWFRKELKRIAGKNRFGRQNLELRWAVTHLDPMQSTEQVKYLDFEHHGTQYGERRFIIEIWRSPEFLKRSHRYETVLEPDTVKEFYFCKACDTEIISNPEALEMLGGLPPCPKCASTRVRTELIRETGGGRLLNEFPSAGCYDYWLRLERADHTYHPPDGEALAVVRALWEWEKTPENQRNALEQADREIQRRQMILAERQQFGNTPQFGSGLIYTR